MNHRAVTVLSQVIATTMIRIADLSNPAEVLRVLAVGIADFGTGIQRAEADQRTTDSWMLTDLTSRVEELEQRARVRESGNSPSADAPPAAAPDGGKPPG